MTQCVEWYGCAVGEGRNRDSITAAGMIGARYSLAVSAWRLKYGNDAKEFETALAALHAASAWVGKGLRLKTARGASKALCKRVLLYWLADVCPSCIGRGETHIEGTPHLDGEPCHHCNGTGRRKLSDGINGREIEQAQAVLLILDTAEHYAAGALMRKLANNMDL